MANYLDKTGLVSVLTKIKTWAEGKLAEKADSSSLATVATTGSYNDLTNKPTIPSAVSVDSELSTSSTNPVQNKVVTAQLNNKVDKSTGKGLSTNDFTTTLKNKLNGIEEGAEVNVNADWNATSGDAQILNKPTIPTNNNQLTNGAGYQTASQVSTAISNAIKDITSFEYEVVSTLPTTGVKGKIYLMAHSHGTGDAYDEYVWIGSAFEKIGNTDIDLSGYVPTTRKVNNKALSSNITLTASDVGAIATGGATNDSALSSTQITEAFTSAGIS